MFTRFWRTSLMHPWLPNRSSMLSRPRGWRKCGQTHTHTQTHSYLLCCTAMMKTVLLNLIGVADVRSLMCQSGTFFVVEQQIQSRIKKSDTCFWSSILCPSFSPDCIIVFKYGVLKPVVVEEGTLSRPSAHFHTGLNFYSSGGIDDVLSLIAQHTH